MSERDDVVQGPLEGEKHPWLGRIGILGAVGTAAPVFARGGVNPAIGRHHAGKGPHLGVKPGEGVGHQGQRLLEADQAARRSRRRGIEIPGGEITDLLGAGHGAQGTSPQILVLAGRRHQGLQGDPLQVPLMAGNVERIPPACPATLAGQLVAPAVDGVEDGGHRLLLRPPGGLDGVPGGGAPGPLRVASRLSAWASPWAAPPPPA